MAGLAVALVCALATSAPAQKGVKRAWPGTIIARSLNVRAGPGQGYPIVAKLKRGDQIEAVDARGRWVRLKGPRDAWVHRAFVRLPRDFLAPEFSKAENAFLEWAAARGDLAEISVDARDRLSIVLDGPVERPRARAVARAIACSYRSQTNFEKPVTTTVWPESGPAAGWIAQATCP